MLARDAQSVELINWTTSSTLHSRGFLSKTSWPSSSTCQHGHLYVSVNGTQTAEAPPACRLSVLTCMSCPLGGWYLFWLQADSERVDLLRPSGASWLPAVLLLLKDLRSVTARRGRLLVTSTEEASVWSSRGSELVPSLLDCNAISSSSSPSSLSCMEEGKLRVRTMRCCVWPSLVHRRCRLIKLFVKILKQQKEKKETLFCDLFCWNLFINCLIKDKVTVKTRSPQLHRCLTGDRYLSWAQTGEISLKFAVSDVRRDSCFPQSFHWRKGSRV